MSFAQPWAREFQNRTLTYLQLAAFHFRLKLAKFPDSSALNQVHNLSPSEKEWVLWTARGKSSWEIGTILAVSRNTVDFHLKNVLRKLDAPSRTIAAFKSVGLGIVEIEKVLVPT
ncbi:LuxR C-terminal-related transcriptional regulator [Mesorhizobium sp.]|uniref:LuxR C-terminal-related transcriptional regulator n=1 Tax=Mesorhizobium sp. TaxID=1871066 RepID=UPI00257D3213|nr:LuxR C-terminal-related transcriptional regulator [Mesorhizobium sp.]